MNPSRRRPRAILQLAFVVAVALSLLVTPIRHQSAEAGDAERPMITASQIDDLRSECEARPQEAGRVQGWAKSRFEQCHRYEERVNLYNLSGAYLGYFDFELWILAFAYSDTRRVDYVVTVEDVHLSSNLVDALTYLTIRLDCRGTHTTCAGPLSRADTIGGWYARPTMDPVVVTTPNGTGDSPYSTLDFVETVGYTAEYRDGDTVPLYRDTVATNRVRFDSAGTALGSGAHHGTVFTDYQPTFEIRTSGDNADEQARHMHDALHNPERTFPTMLGKNVPGRDRPLHRLMDQAKRDANRQAAISVCRAVWGDDYATGGLQCDEYPFSTTYEGAAESTGGRPGLWHGSARPIDGADNEEGGRMLGRFYGANRVLDGDPYFVNVIT